MRKKITNIITILRVVLVILSVLFILSTAFYSKHQYTQADLETLRGLINEECTNAQLERYDMNDDGTITGADLIILRNLLK